MSETLLFVINLPSGFITLQDEEPGAEPTKIEPRKVLEEALERLQKEGHVLGEPFWSTSSDGRQLQVVGMTRADYHSQVLLDVLEDAGVGPAFGSISVLDLEFARVPEARVAPVGPVAAAVPAAPAKMESGWNVTAASVMRVEQVLVEIRDAAVFSFDYLCLVLVAATLAGAGLATNNTVVIVASMLVSPIMGPVMAATFGSVVRDWDLVKIGIRSELISLALCVLTGVVVGVVALFMPWWSALETWPTPEMDSRALLSGLPVGAVIAIASGLGVALSVLGNNTSSLVGVAISASLLPPAVNAGMLLVLGWATKSHIQCLKMAGVSLLLTVLNIVCIYLAAFGMFKIKEVAPIKRKASFWSKDLRLAREVMHAEPEQLEQIVVSMDNEGKDDTGAPDRPIRIMRRASHSLTMGGRPYHLRSAMDYLKTEAPPSASAYPHLGLPMQSSIRHIHRARSAQLTRAKSNL